jgi:hypothetical protein
MTRTTPPAGAIFCASTSRRSMPPGHDPTARSCSCSTSRTGATPTPTPPLPWASPARRSCATQPHRRRRYRPPPVDGHRRRSSPPDPSVAMRQR